MSRWQKGEAEVEAAIERGDLQVLSKTAADGSRLLERAKITLRTARSVTEEDPVSGYVLAYNSARQALTALLVQQGLRPTSKGGHYIVERVAIAQFGAGFRIYGTMRRRRNELEYPSITEDETSISEAREVVEDVEQMLLSAEALIGTLGIF